MQHGGNVQLIEHMSNQIIELKNEKQAMKKSMEKLLEKVGNVTHITNNQQNVYKIELFTKGFNLETVQFNRAFPSNRCPYLLR